MMSIKTTVGVGSVVTAGALPYTGISSTAIFAVAGLGALLLAIGVLLHYWAHRA